MIALFDVAATRYGALGLRELEATEQAVMREKVQEAFEMHLNSMGPGDRLTLVLVRR